VIKFCYCSALTLMGAVIVHIGLLFFIPSYAGNSISARLALLQEAQEEGHFIALDREDPIVARLDPAFRLRACSLDLNEGPVRLTAAGDVPFWSLSLYGEDGSNLYSINSRIMPAGQLDLVIGDPIQIMDYKHNNALEGQGIGGQDESVTTQHNIARGFVILRAYSPSSDWEFLVNSFLDSARCSQI